MKFMEIDPSFLNSEKYQKIIKSQYKTRHEDYRMIGAWRWKGVMEHYKLIMGYVYNPDLVGIDFGGSDGPIGGYTTIIDKQLDNDIEYLYNNSLDYIFSSHTLEHVEELDYTIVEMYDKLKRHGKIIFNIPSYKKRVWRAETDPHHNHTFKLAETEDFDAIEIDTLLKERGYTLDIAEYCGDWGIFIFGEKSW